MHERITIDGAQALPIERIELAPADAFSAELLRRRVGVWVGGGFDAGRRRKAQPNELLHQFDINLVSRPGDRQLETVFQAERLVALERKAKTSDIKGSTSRQRQQR